ncbi:unnamed protein product [Paramecium octaurelia]|uniref:Uncharacterized protein n=1 Tax=Paramecium octaurelia TaxID=43137 RepID=A0A8S1XJH5_PAROT|nr:unnamed protein product [Paramecium octaurelia]
MEIIFQILKTYIYLFELLFKNATQYFCISGVIHTYNSIRQNHFSSTVLFEYQQYGNNVNVFSQLEPNTNLEIRSKFYPGLEVKLSTQFSMMPSNRKLKQTKLPYPIQIRFTQLIKIPSNYTLQYISDDQYKQMNKYTQIKLIVHLSFRREVLHVSQEIFVQTIDVKYPTVLKILF